MASMQEDESVYLAFGTRDLPFNNNVELLALGHRSHRILIRYPNLERDDRNDLRSKTRFGRLLEKSLEKIETF